MQNSQFQDWLKTFIEQLMVKSKQELIESLGQPQNPLEATLINIKPFNPKISSIDLRIKNDKWATSSDDVLFYNLVIKLMSKFYFAPRLSLQPMSRQKYSKMDIVKSVQ